MHLNKLTGQLCQQRFAMLEYIFCGNADRSSSFLEHHFVLLSPLKLDHFPKEHEWYCS